MTRIRDLVMTSRRDADEFFCLQVQAPCAQRGLRFFLNEPLWGDGFLSDMEAGGTWPRVLLHWIIKHHDPTDISHRLVKPAAAKGTQVFDPPEAAIAALNMSRLHGRLQMAGLSIPYPLVETTGEREGFGLTPLADMARKPE